MNPNTRAVPSYALLAGVALAAQALLSDPSPASAKTDVDYEWSYTVTPDARPLRHVQAPQLDAYSDYHGIDANAVADVVVDPRGRVVRTVEVSSDPGTWRLVEPFLEQWMWEARESAAEETFRVEIHLAKPPSERRKDHAWPHYLPCRDWDAAERFIAGSDSVSVHFQMDHDHDPTLLAAGVTRDWFARFTDWVFANQDGTLDRKAHSGPIVSVLFHQGSVRTALLLNIGTGTMQFPCMPVPPEDDSGKAWGVFATAELVPFLEDLSGTAELPNLRNFGGRPLKESGDSRPH